MFPSLPSFPQSSSSDDSLVVVNTAPHPPPPLVPPVPPSNRAAASTGKTSTHPPPLQPQTSSVSSEAQSQPVSMATVTNSSAPSSLEDMDTQQSGLQPSPDSNSKVMMLIASSFNHVCLEHAFCMYVVFMFSYLFCCVYVCVCVCSSG